MPNSLKKEFEERIYMYPFDALYIQKIAQRIGLSVGKEYKLFSIMGAQELADTLPLATYKNFQSESNNSFRFNLHLHTNHSKAVLTTEDVLKQAILIADKNAQQESDLPPFTIAFSDYNNAEATKEALQILSANPQRYKNLRVVLASELKTIYQVERNQKPIEFELIYYGLNPFDKEFNNYLKGNKAYLKLDDLFDLQRQSEFGFLGLAHPQKINISAFLSKDFVQECNKKCINPSYQMMNFFLMMLKDKGLRALEINYQFRTQSFKQAQKMLLGQIPVDKNNTTYQWLKFFDYFAENYGMLKTGGYNTHNDKITAQ